MKKLNLIIFLVLLLITPFIKAQVNIGDDFPYNLPMNTGVGLTPIPFSGKSTANKTVTLPTFGSEGMTISKEQVMSSFSGAYFTDLKFSTDKGFVIEFEYVVYSNTTSTSNNVNNVSDLGDGFALVLFDGSIPAANISAGARGSGLGYSYNRATNVGGNVPGFTGGYLGIGFDSYGGHHKQGYTTAADVDWRNGIFYNPGTYTYVGPGSTDFVTVRGPVSSDNTYGVNRAGYPVLITQNTYSRRTNTTSTSMYYSQLNPNWNPSTQSYAEAYTKQEINTFTPFQIGGRVAAPKYLQNGYRKAKIEMIPDKTNKGIFYLNVSIIVDSETNPRKVIKKYKIDTNSTVNYSEMKNYSSGTTYANYNTPATLSMKSPATLNMGWTAATGDAWANTIIRAATVTLPYSPIVVDDASSICKNYNSVTSISPLDNDYGFDISQNEPQPDNSFLDKTSFRFMVPQANSLNMYKANSTQYSYKTSNATYTYNSSTGIISAQVTNASLATTTIPDTLYYDIRNKAVGEDAYRSKVAKITVSFDGVCKAEPTKPTANDDAVSICTLKGSTVTLSPLSNDVGYGYNSNGTLVSGNSYLDIASFTFVSSTGVTITNATTASTANASYSYDTTTGVLRVTTLKAMTNGISDALAYTVKNTGGTTASNTANITVIFDSSKCPVVLPAPTANPDIVNICNTMSTSKAITPLSNDVGYIFNSSNAVVSGTGQYLNVSSFNFTNSSGTALADPYNTSTTNASYSYNATTGILTVKVLKSVTSGTSDKLYYTVTNSTTTTKSTPATITTNFLSSECAAPSQSVPLLRTVNVTDRICSKEGTSTSVDALTNCVGYAIVDNIQKSDKSYIDKTSFQFTTQSGVALSTASPYECNTTYANYSYDATTGYITITLLPNSISNQVENIVYYTVTNTTGNKSRSNVGMLYVLFDSNACPLENVWIKINAPRKGLFINGAGNLSPNE